MSGDKKQRRVHRQRKKRSKQLMKQSSHPLKTISADDDVQFTLSKDGRMKVATCEDKLPKFLIEALNAMQSDRMEQARALITDDNIEIVRQMMKKDPSNIGVMYMLAATLLTLGRIEEAEQWYEDIRQTIEPHWAVFNELANINEKKQQYAKEMEYRQKAIEGNPDNGILLNNYGMLLVRMGRAKEGNEILRQAIPKASHNPVVHSNLVFFMHYLPDVDRQSFFEEHKQWARDQTPIKLARTSHDNDPDPDRRLRIGYVSPDFCTHSVAHFFEILLDEQNRREIETFGYGNVESPDEVTERLKSKFDHYRNILGVNDTDIVDMVLKDKIDILVDLSGHTGFNRMTVFGYKPAPVQVSYLGYPDTTGMEQVDYRFTDEIADPPESQKFYTEKLFYLPDGFLSYKPPDYAPPVGPLPALENGYITFGSFNNNCKIDSAIMTIWAEVLKANKDSRMILKFRGGQVKVLQQHYLGEFEKLGISPDRIEIHGGLFPIEHLNLYNRIDIALDTYPYNGTTTTFEALWMGVPVISLVGEHHMSRVGLSILTRFGMGFLAASTPEEYVVRAAALAAKTDTLAEMRAVMRRTIAGASLCNTSKFVKNVEAAYRTMWHKWCENQDVNIDAQEIASQEQRPGDEIKISSITSVGPVAGPSELRQKEPSEKPPVRLFHNLARAGGTLVCKCLGCMDKTVLLSEIHPLATRYYNPLAQAHQWHNLLKPVDIRVPKEEKIVSFAYIIELINKRCVESGQKLLIRDWGHLDFIAVPFLKKPSYRMLLAEALASSFEVIQLALVRHPVDQWLSLSKIAVMHENLLSVEMFLKGYLRFAEQAAGIGFIRYEDFTAKPLWQMKIICEKLQLDFDEDFINKWFDYEKITGDVGKLSRGSSLRRIEPLPRQPAAPELLKHFHENDDYWQAIYLLNYPDVEQGKSSARHPRITISTPVCSAAKKPEKHAKRKINAERIFISSMPRAGSMWTYNVTRALIQSAGLEVIPQSVPIEPKPFISRAFKEPPKENQVHCIKTHYVVEPPEGDSHTLIIVPYRDIRDCIMSYMKFMNVDFEYAVRAMRHWNPTDEYFKKQTDNILKIRYDQITNEPLDTIQKIDSFIDSGASFEAIEQINERFSKKNVKKKVDGLKNISTEQVLANPATLSTVKTAKDSYRVFDNGTGFQTGHVSSRKDGHWREALSEDQKKFLMEETADWLERNGFEL